MKRFVVIYHAPISAMEQMANAGPEDMKPWMDWAAKCGDGLVDMGTPLGGGQKLTKSGNSPSDKSVMGYSIVQADDIQSAMALLQGHPHLEMAAGCEIEVHESLPLPM
jgi:hypothetical protein